MAVNLLTPEATCLWPLNIDLMVNINEDLFDFNNIRSYNFVPPNLFLPAVTGVRKGVDIYLVMIPQHL